MSSVPHEDLTRYDVTDTSDESTEREAGIAAAVTAIRVGDLVVLPTDTVYGVAADAFDPAAVQKLLDAKGRGRDMPPPVLVGAVATIDALATRLPVYARTLIERFWPGPLTVVVRQQTSLQWDLGETLSTVAVRMPDDATTLELLARTGPLAVSSANTTGSPAATTADQAVDMLGDFVKVVLDSGPSSGEQASTIVDCTSDRPRVLRAGVLSADDLTAALSDLGVELEGLSEGA